jgi:hypothetical protein
MSVQEMKEDWKGLPLASNFDFPASNLLASSSKQEKGRKLFRNVQRRRFRPPMCKTMLNIHGKVKNLLAGQMSRLKARRSLDVFQRVSHSVLRYLRRWKRTYTQKFAYFLSLTATITRGRTLIIKGGATELGMHYFALRTKL